MLGFLDMLTTVTVITCPHSLRVSTNKLQTSSHSLVVTRFGTSRRLRGLLGKR